LSAGLGIDATRPLSPGARRTPWLNARPLHPIDRPIEWTVFTTVAAVGGDGPIGASGLAGVRGKI
jgi:hypothetical protein